LQKDISDLVLMMNIVEIILTLATHFDWELQ